jgi:hypothetical protein
MAKLTIQLETLAGTATYTGPEVTEANMDRFVEYLWGRYAPFDDVPPGGFIKPRSPATEIEAFQNWGGRLWITLKDLVKKAERKTAQDAANAAIVDLD